MLELFSEELAIFSLFFPIRNFITINARKTNVLCYIFT